jgi:putative toxin-antitoxin system antitoxin component (TIGR02293 family)
MATMDDIVKVLGGSGVLKRRVKNMGDLDLLAQDGLPYQSLENVMATFGLARGEVEKVLLVPSRTLARRKARARMRAAESDRLMRLARVGARASQVLGTYEKAARWLHRPNRALNNRLPLELLQTDLGTKQVEDILTRIEHGVVG